MNHSGNFKAIRVKYLFAKHVDIYREDCNRIQGVLLDHGFYATLEQCAELWELASEDMCAGWLSLPEKNEDIYTEVFKFIEVQD